MQNGTNGGKEPATTSAASTSGIDGMSGKNLGERLISVRAQVMAWDDRYCGWLPLEGGGPSTIALYQRLIYSPTSGSSVNGGSPQAQHRPLEQTTSAPKFEYVIRGERVQDKKITLYCHLRKDVSYRQVMPTFHHWQIEENKFGLKFMSSYEACKFHNRVRKAIEHLYRQSKSSSGDSNVEADELEDDVFVPVELPLSRAESWESEATNKSVPAIASASTSAAIGPYTSLLQKAFPSYSSTAVPATVHQPPSVKQKKSAVPPDISGRPGRTKTWPKSPPPAGGATTSGTTLGLRFPYVHFQKDASKATAYTKPAKPISKTELHASASFGQLSPYASRSVSMGRSSLDKRESVGSLKLSLVQQQLTLPTGMSRKPTKSGATRSSPLELLRRERCFYCKAYYVERDNRRGVCPDAPDPVSKWLRRLTCLWCADCVLYCCCRDWSDGEGARQEDVCSCSPMDPTRRKRWTVLAVLALLVPCLWCYPPLAACHRCCRRRCPLLGGRHAPSGPAATRQSVGSMTGRTSSLGRMSMTPEPSSMYK